MVLKLLKRLYNLFKSEKGKTFYFAKYKLTYQRSTYKIRIWESRGTLKLIFPDTLRLKLDHIPSREGVGALLEHTPPSFHLSHNSSGAILDRSTLNIIKGWHFHLLWIFVCPLLSMLSKENIENRQVYPRSNVFILYSVLALLML